MTSPKFWYHHAGVSVDDMDGQIAWYRRVLGFEVQRRYFVESIPAEIAMLGNGPLQVELLRVPSPGPADPARSTPDDDLLTMGNKHVAYSCNDVGEMADFLRARGAEIVWVKEMTGGRKVCFLRDLEGNLIEFVQYPQAADPYAWA